MSVYYKENPEFLKISMESMLNQTVPPADFVLVCDGPLTKELDKVIEFEQTEHKEILQVVRLDHNVGLGEALNCGIKQCKYELIARMDSDDISYLDRCEKQLKFFKEHPDYAICGGVIEEFNSDPNVIISSRITPQTNEQIRSFIKKRNPFNHMSVMYRKSMVENSGGYQSFYLLEDYYLWVRMIHDGAKGYNIQEPLLKARTGDAMFSRRGGWRYVQSQIALFNYMNAIGMITKTQRLASITVRMISGVLPNTLRRSVFLRFLRK